MAVPLDAAYKVHKLNNVIDPWDVPLLDEDSDSDEESLSTSSDEKVEVDQDIRNVLSEINVMLKDDNIPSSEFISEDPYHRKHFALTNFNQMLRVERAQELNWDTISRDRAAITHVRLDEARVTNDMMLFRRRGVPVVNYAWTTDAQYLASPFSMYFTTYGAGGGLPRVPVGNRMTYPNLGRALAKIKPDHGIATLIVDNLSVDFDEVLSKSWITVDGNMITMKITIDWMIAVFGTADAQRKNIGCYPDYVVWRLIIPNWSSMVNKFDSLIQRLDSIYIITYYIPQHPHEPMCTLVMNKRTEYQTNKYIGSLQRGGVITNKCRRASFIVRNLDFNRLYYGIIFRQLVFTNVYSRTMVDFIKDQAAKLHNQLNPLVDNRQQMTIIRDQLKYFSQEEKDAHKTSMLIYFYGADRVKKRKKGAGKAKDKINEEVISFTNAVADNYNAIRAVPYDNSDFE